MVSIPAQLDAEYNGLYNQVFTCRVDSPKWLIRVLESREYSCKGRSVIPENCGERVTGSITIDNENYGRYTGEIQIIRSNLKADDRVNCDRQDSTVCMAASGTDPGRSEIYAGQTLKEEKP